MARASTWNELALAHWAGNRERAVVDDDRVVSGEELLRLAGGAAALFDDLGFGVGDAVPALIDETPDAIALAVGAALSRRPLAPLGTKLAVPELARPTVSHTTRLAAPTTAPVRHHSPSVT